MLPTTQEPARGLQAPRAVHTLLVRACHPQHLGGVFCTAGVQYGFVEIRGPN